MANVFDLLKAEVAFDEERKAAKKISKKTGVDETSVASMMSQMAPEDRDYFVEIVREDLPEINEATGKPMGWKKKVHRYTTELGKDPKKKG